MNTLEEDSSPLAAPAWQLPGINLRWGFASGNSVGFPQIYKVWRKKKILTDSPYLCLSNGCLRPSEPTGQGDRPTVLNPRKPGFTRRCANSCGNQGNIYFYSSILPACHCNSFKGSCVSVISKTWFVPSSSELLRHL